MAQKHTAHGFWLEEAGSPAPRPPLAGEVDADVVVVGGGFTGMWTAWWILEHEPEARVVVLEAASCGHGPTGRNGGFVNAMSFSLPTPRAASGGGARSRESTPGIAAPATSRYRPLPLTTGAGSRSPMPGGGTASLGPACR